MIVLLEALKDQPLFAVGLTLAAYAVADAVWERSGRSAFLNPVLVGSALVATLLVVLSISYADYIENAQPINEALAAIVILLAVPLCRQFHLIKMSRKSVLIATLYGSAVAFTSALALPVFSGTEDALMVTITPKSTTAAVAVEISERFGGISSLTAVIVISSGIFGSAFGPAILKASGVTDERAKGFALGLASHAIGTARAFQISETTGAFASLGMVLNALLTLALAPLVIALVLWI